MITFITFLALIAPIDVSGIVAALVFIGGLISLYIKQVKDVQEIKLTMKRDKEDTDKEIALVKLQLDAQGLKDETMLSLLSDVKTNLAVSDEKLSNLVKILENKVIGK
jgi:hypothetical protein